MPKCIVCSSSLPPDFLTLTDDGLAQKCLFCIKGTDSIEYFSESEGRTMTVTKNETIKEYVEFLRELSDIPNVKDVIDAIKERGEKNFII
jgi:hypothetical protein